MHATFDERLGEGLSKLQSGFSCKNILMRYLLKLKKKKTNEQLKKSYGVNSHRKNVESRLEKWFQAVTK